MIVANLVGYLTLIAAAVLGLNILPEGAPRAFGMGLIAAYSVLFILSPDENSEPWKQHFYIFVQTLIVSILITFTPNNGVFLMLFFVLSAQAMMMLPRKQGFIWIAIFILATFITFMINTGLEEAFLSLLPYSAGYAFFGAFAVALADARAERKRSEELLAELQDAHKKLQDYASGMEQLVISEERNRLAREMHDTLGHQLTVASVQLEGAQRLVDTDPKRAADIIGTVREQVRVALNDLRRTVATLREPLDTDLSLPHALNKLVDSFDDATGLTVHLALPDDFTPIPETHRLALYRTAQESLTNVQRHAEAKNVWLKLSQDKPNYRVSLTISDDGHGFTEDTQPTGFGLRGLYERAAQLDGELQFSERDGGGALVYLSLPLPMEATDG